MEIHTKAKVLQKDEALAHVVKMVNNLHDKRGLHDLRHYFSSMEEVVNDELFHKEMNEAKNLNELKIWHAEECIAASDERNLKLVVLVEYVKVGRRSCFLHDEKAREIASPAHSVNQCHTHSLEHHEMQMIQDFVVLLHSCSFLDLCLLVHSHLLYELCSHVVEVVVQLSYLS